MRGLGLRTQFTNGLFSPDRHAPYRCARARDGDRGSLTNGTRITTVRVVESILAAAVQAPSGGNIQPYQFLVVRDPERKAALADIYLRSWQRYESAVAKVTPPPASPGSPLATS